MNKAIETRLKYPGYSEEKKAAIICGITDEKLEKMFSKYELYQLECLNDIFENVQDYSISIKANIIQRLINKKYEEAKQEFSVPYKPAIYSYSSLSNKNQLLNDEELEYLQMTTSILYDYLAKSKDTEAINEDDFYSLEEFKNSLDMEMHRRINKPKLKLKLKLKSVN